MHLYTFFVHLQCLTTAIPVVLIDAANRNCISKQNTAMMITIIYLHYQSHKLYDIHNLEEPLVNSRAPVVAVGLLPHWYVC